MVASNVSVLALAGVLAFGPPAGEREVASPSPLQAPDSVEVIVTGLSCPFCAFGLEKKLKSFDGIGEITIEAATGKVSFALAEGHELTEEKLRGLVKDAGFQVEEIRRAPWLPDPGSGRE